MMHQLSSEILLIVFKELSSKEMVKVMRVCKEWLNIIDENKSLWRRLVLPGKRDGWEVSIVELFDRKSASSLKEVSIRTKLRSGQVEPLMELLEKNKETLQILHLVEVSWARARPLCDLSWKLPRLIDCRVMNRVSTDLIKLQMKGESDGEKVAQNPKEMTKLKILWSCPLDSLERLFNSQLQRLDQLASLSLEDWVPTSRLAPILRRLAPSLKHLRVWVSVEEELPQQVPNVIFPILEALNINTEDDKFPSWMKIPPSAFIKCESFLLGDLPRTAKLWVVCLDEIGILEDMCPDLVELNFKSVDPSHFNEWNCQRIVTMLRQRQENVNAGTEIDGVAMIPLKRFVCALEKFDLDHISQLRELVEEVVDVKTVDRFIEVEI